ncbi:MAG: ribose 5-phosphate isomerase B [Heliobacteriaceae bacterium]|jgi:ribose 5-phosphate isomerase B|nr:ribose 5-phosphate isomerase B [Heliobacteriaceae bacterium]
MTDLKVAIGADHAGFRYKEKIKEYLQSGEQARLIPFGLNITDFGTYNEESCDYPVVAYDIARKIASGEFDRGILVCGTGQGMAMAANRVEGIRAAVCTDTFSAGASRTHNNANILCLGQRVTGEGLMLDIVNIWLASEFLGGRHQKRVDMIK